MLLIYFITCKSIFCFIQNLNFIGAEIKVHSLFFVDKEILPEKNTPLCITFRATVYLFLWLSRVVIVQSHVLYMTMNVKARMYCKISIKDSCIKGKLYDFFC